MPPSRTSNLSEPSCSMALVNLSVTWPCSLSTYWVPVKYRPAKAATATPAAPIQVVVLPIIDQPAHPKKVPHRLFGVAVGGVAVGGVAVGEVSRSLPCLRPATFLGR